MLSTPAETVFRIDELRKHILDTMLCMNRRQRMRTNRHLLEQALDNTPRIDNFDQSCGILALGSNKTRYILSAMISPHHHVKIFQVQLSKLEHGYEVGWILINDVWREIPSR